MAIDVFNDLELPTGTAVESYTIRRLGKNVQLIVRFTETVSLGELNDFGRVALRGAKDGRSWEITFNSASPDQLAVMRGVMGSIMVKFIVSSLVALGEPAKTPAEIIAALAQGEDIDSVIASELEQLEVRRRAGTLTVGSIMGQAPHSGTAPGPAPI